MVRVYRLGYIDIALAVRCLAKGLRGPKGYRLATRIVILATVVLSGTSYAKAPSLIRATGLYWRLGAGRMPSPKAFWAYWSDGL